ncbi:MAG: class I SAM-dependent methyltransferase [candidate division WOR-3 bacterium]
MTQASPFDALARKYDAWYDGKGRLAFEIELAALRPLLRKLPGPWLEVGVGTGRFAQALGIRIGVDPSAELLKLARQRGVEAIHASGESLPFPAETFGTVFLLTTWEFLDEPEKVLAEIRRVLKPAGMFVNAYLDREGKWGASYVEKGRAGHPLFSHARFDTFDDVRRITEAAGFAVAGVSSTLFQGPGETTVTEEPRAGYERGASFVVVVARKTVEG